jgi:hypothetical protein
LSAGGRDEDGPDDAPLTVDDLHPAIDAAVASLVDERLERLMPRHEATSDPEDAEEDGPFELEVLDHPFQPLGPSASSDARDDQSTDEDRLQHPHHGITIPLSTGLTPEGAGRGERGRFADRTS